MTAKCRSDGKCTARLLQGSFGFTGDKDYARKTVKGANELGTSQRCFRPCFQRAAYTSTVPSVPRIQTGETGMRAMPWKLLSRTERGIRTERDGKEQTGWGQNRRGSGWAGTEEMARCGVQQVLRQAQVLTSTHVFASRCDG